MVYICASDGKYIIGTKEAVKTMEKHDPGITNGGGFMDILEEAEFSLSSMEEIASKMKAGKSGHAVYEYRNERRHTSYIPLGISDWYIVAVLEEKCNGHGSDNLSDACSADNCGIGDFYLPYAKRT